MGGLHSADLINSVDFSIVYSIKVL